MDARRFDRLTSAFSVRLSRRDSLRATGVGLGTAALGGLALPHPALAQDATPAAPEVDHLGLPEGERTFFMFVQTASGGTWAPKPGEEGVYTLTLTGLPAQTVYFSDRPQRIVGTQSTADFLQVLGFTPDNPPNAALVTNTPDGEEILVIEIYNPVWTEGADEDGATLVYDARILDSYHETTLGGVAELQSDPAAMPAEFAGASLFIDDCPDAQMRCHGTGGPTLVNYGCCYSFPTCQHCWDVSGICASVPGCENGCPHEVAASCSGWDDV